MSRRIAASTIPMAIALCAATGRADPAPWIAIESPGDCSDATAALPQRVREALVGRPADALHASVTIEERDGEYRTTVRTARGEATLGVKVVSAPTCEDAVDAAVVVLAMALARQPVSDVAAPAEPEIRPVATLPDSPPQKQSRGWLRPATLPSADHPSARRGRAGREPNTRVSLLTGVDAGTLPLATMFIGAGIARQLGPVELRGVLRYGLPRVEEEETAGQSERRRADFGSADVGVCVARGAHWSLSACAGGELGLARRELRVRGREDLDIDTEAVEPRFAGVLGAVVGYRAGVVQPELELSGAAAAVRPEDGSWLAVRAGVGLAVQF